MLIRKLGGADALRASLMQFEMREDGTIEREWLEGKVQRYASNKDKNCRWGQHDWSLPHWLFIYF